MKTYMPIKKNTIGIVLPSCQKWTLHVLPFSSKLLVWSCIHTQWKHFYHLIKQHQYYVCIAGLPNFKLLITNHAMCDSQLDYVFCDMWTIKCKWQHHAFKHKNKDKVNIQPTIKLYHNIMKSYGQTIPLVTIPHQKNTRKLQITLSLSNQNE